MEQATILHAWKKHSLYDIVRSKAFAVLAANENVDVETISKVVGKSKQTVQRWLRKWRETGLESVVCVQASNIWASKLTPGQKQQVYTTLQNSPNSILPGRFWDVPKLKNYIRSEFDVAYNSDRSYHMLLKHAGLSFKYPELRNEKRASEAEVNAQIRQLNSKIGALSKDTVVLAQDEVRVELNVQTVKAWLRKGERTIVGQNSSKEAQSFSGFLNLGSGEVDLYRVERSNTSATIASLRSILVKYLNVNVAVVWDNAPWHRSKELRALLGEGNEFERVTLFNLPPYCPDFNPVELVWKDAKQHCSNEQFKNIEAVNVNFEKYVKSRKFNYQLRRTENS